MGPSSSSSPSANREVDGNFWAVLDAGIVNAHAFDASKAQAATEIFISKVCYETDKPERECRYSFCVGWIVRIDRSCSP